MTAETENPMTDPCVPHRPTPMTLKGPKGDGVVIPPTPASPLSGTRLNYRYFAEFKDVRGPNGWTVPSDADTGAIGMVECVRSWACTVYDLLSAAGFADVPPPSTLYRVRCQWTSKYARITPARNKAEAANEEHCWARALERYVLNQKARQLLTPAAAVPEKSPLIGWTKSRPREVVLYGVTFPAVPIEVHEGWTFTGPGDAPYRWGSHIAPLVPRNLSMINTVVAFVQKMRAAFQSSPKFRGWESTMPDGYSDSTATSPWTEDNVKTGANYGPNLEYANRIVRTAHAMEAQLQSRLIALAYGTPLRLLDLTPAATLEERGAVVGDDLEIIKTRLSGLTVSAKEIEAKVDNLFDGLAARVDALEEAICPNVARRLQGLESTNAKQADQIACLQKQLDEHCRRPFTSGARLDVLESHLSSLLRSMAQHAMKCAIEPSNSLAEAQRRNHHRAQWLDILRSAFDAAVQAAKRTL